MSSSQYPHFVVRISILLFVLGGLWSSAWGQNLIPNPGFEDYKRLPNQEYDFSAVKDWFNPGTEASPAYLHTAGKAGAKLPRSAKGFVNPESGEAIVGITAYDGTHENFRNYREYISVKLKEPLVPGKRYQVAFFYSNGVENQHGKYGSDKLGFYFSKDRPVQSKDDFMEVQPNYEVASSLFSPFWEEVVFQFEPFEANEYLTIGVFRGDDDLDLSVGTNDPNSGQYAYFFLDEISVIPVELLGNPFRLYCPDNFEVTTDPGTCDSRAPYPIPDIRGPSDITLTRLSELASGDPFPLGVNTVRYEATDPEGRREKCTFTITVLDTESPSLLCPNNIVEQADPGTTSKIVNYPVVEANDNCSQVDLTQLKGLSSGSPFPIGTTEMAFKAEDAAGNRAECFFTVTVAVREIPLSIDCPMDIRVNTVTGKCESPVPYPLPEIKGPEGLQLTQTDGLKSGATFPKGITRMAFEVTDKTGQKADCEFSISVWDAEAPSLQCPEDIVVQADPGATQKVVDYPISDPTDNCGKFKSKLSIGPGSVFKLGTTKVAYTAVDEAGNEAECGFTVTVEPTIEKLTLNCPDNIRVNTAPGLCTRSVPYPDPEMKGPGDAVLTQLSGLKSTEPFPKGITEVSFQATDKSGQKAGCSFTVTVVDEEPPQLRCPEDIAVKTEPGKKEVPVEYVVMLATDNCSNVSAQLQSGLPSTAPFPVGSTQITYSAEDESGNYAECSFSVQVTATVLPLTLTCPESQEINTDPGKCRASVGYSLPVLQGPEDAVLTQTQGPKSGSNLPKGTTEFSFEAADKSGQKANCQFTITIIDREPPVIKCPSDINVKTAPGEQQVSVEYPPASSTDNCDPVTPNLGGSLVSGSKFPIGATSVTYTATDKAGNTSDCSFNVNVEGTAKLLTLKCPENIQVATATGKCEAPVEFSDPVMEGPEDALLTQTAGPKSGANFPKGTTNLSFEASDKTGQKANCAFTVTVKDEESPVVKCPSDINVKTEPGEQEITVEYAPATATDNCDAVTLKLTAGSASGTKFPVGSTTQTFTATDQAANAAECNFTVNVEGTAKLLTLKLKCPENIQVATATGKCENTVEYPDPVMEGPEDAVLTQTAGSKSGATFPKGTTELAFEASDKTGQKANCAFKVTVKDEEKPVVKCPADISVKTEPGEQEIAVEYPAATATDNCDAVSPKLTVGPASGTKFPEGSTTVTFTATDQGGNTAECSFTVNVEGTAKLLTLKCPDNIQVATAADKCENRVEYPAPVMEGPEDAVLTQTAGSKSGATFPKGTTELAFEASYKTGQKANCAFTVTVKDEEKPVVKCPADINVKTEPGEQEIVVEYPPATATDNCDAVTPKLTAGSPSGSKFPVGSSTVTFTATDQGGNTAECSFNVNVEGTAKLLTLKCPEDIQVTTAAGKCENKVEYPAPVMEGPEDAILTQTAGSKSGATFPKGTTELAFEASDKTGQKANCAFTVTVKDEEKPVVKCPADINVKTEPGEQEITVEYAPATATDNCDAVSTKLTTGKASGTKFPVGSTTVTFTATDQAGNTAECSFKVNVEGTAKLLTLKCPENIQVATATGKCENTVEYPDPVMEGPVDAVLTQTAGSKSGATFPKGTTELAFEASDKTGQKANCAFTVTVKDEEKPVVKCPSDINVKTEPGEQEITVEYAPATATDNCDPVTPKQTAGPAPGTKFPVGSTTVTFTATDQAGNEAECSFKVYVEGTAKLLTLKCPENIQMATATGKCDAPVEYPAPVMEGPEDAVLTQTAGPKSGATFPKGTTDLSFEATDKTGQKANCAFTVTVKDEEKPVVKCPSDINVKTEPGEQEITVEYAPATATDNCDAVTPKLTAGPASGTKFPVGSTTVTFTGTDQAGNTAECSFNVKVEGTAKLLTLKCPENIQVATATGKCDAPVQYPAPVMEGPEDAVLTQTAGPKSGATFPKGTTELAFEASDKTGQKANCAFTVTVKDEEKPVVKCPSDINVKTEPGEQEIVVEYPPATATDNCDAVTPKLSTGPASGTKFPIGSTTVTFTATDQAGNEAECSFKVNVEGTAKLLTLKCPENIQVATATGKCENNVDYPAPVMEGPEDAALTQTAGPKSGATFPKGTTELSFEASDKTGQKANCAFTVTVKDEEKPVVKCPSDISVKTEPGEQEITVEYAPATATDNCDAVSTKFTKGKASGTKFPVGSTTVTFTATDQAGNTAECSFNINVEGTAKLLTLKCAENIQVATAAGKCETLVEFPDPVMEGPEDAVLTQTAGSKSGATFPKGTTELAFEASDKTGQIANCAFTVTVKDEEPPVVKCPSDINVNTEPGEQEITVEYAPATATDNCDAVTPKLTAGPATGTKFPVGSSTVTFTATDQAGNAAECSFNIIIEGTAKLLTLKCPENIQVATALGKCENTVEYPDPVMEGPEDAVLTQTSGPKSGATFPKGTTELSFEASDKTGQKANCAFSVTVKDEEKPIVKCPSDINVKTEPGEQEIAVEYPAATATDNCDAVTPKMTAGSPSGTKFPVGSITVTFTATDQSGSEAECTFNVKVEGTAKLLTLKCPENIQVATALGKCESTVEYPDPVMEGPEDAVLTQTSGPKSGATFPKGTTELSFEASDKTGQKANCSFTVTVKDEEKPVVKCPADINVKTEPGEQEMVVEYPAATATDNCDAVSTKLTTGKASGSKFPIGSSTVTFTATDLADNTAECSFNINVEGTAKLLTLKCPENIQVATAAGKCEAPVEYPDPAMEGPDDAILTQTAGPKSGASFSKGTTELAFEASDKTGQKANCSFTVTVKDEEKPVVKCPADINVKTEPGEQEIVVKYPAATTTDNCDAVSPKLSTGPASGTKFPIGSTTVTYTATDQAGNSGDCSFMINVKETIIPVVINCPDNIKVGTEPGSCEAGVAYHNPDFSGPEGVKLERLTGPASGSAFPKGTTRIGFEAKAPSGISKKCAFSVEVVDEEPPTIVCPEDKVVYPDPGVNRQKVTYTKVLASDNCGNISPNLESGPASGGMFEAGPNSVVYSATDEAGNRVECSFTITLETRPQQIDGDTVVYEDDVINIPSAKCTIYYYDHIENDGDIVSINVDGNWLVENERIRNKRDDFTKTDNIEVTLEPDKLHYIIFKAIDEGKNPPCTLTLAIYDEKDDFLMRHKVRFEIGESAGITLKMGK